MFGRNRRNPTVRDTQVPVEGSQSAGVPEHLEIPLRRWIGQKLDGEDSAEKVAIHLQLRVESGHTYSPRDFLARYTTAQEIPDVIDAMLRLSAPPPRESVQPSAETIQRLNLAAYAPTAQGGVRLELRWQAIGELQEILRLGGAPYRVNAAQDGLEVRVDATAHKALAGSLAASRIPQSGSSGEHLANAWKCAYGRDPDPTKAYSEAIKAVEAAAQCVVEPRNSKATLGTMLKVLGNAPQKFSTAIPASNGDDISLVADMMRRLWQGQTSRHGSQTPTQLETQQQAEMAVHLAVTLVQWFTAGLVRRAP